MNHLLVYLTLLVFSSFSSSVANPEIPFTSIFLSNDCILPCTFFSTDAVFVVTIDNSSFSPSLLACLVAIGFSFTRLTMYVTFNSA